MTEDEKDRSHGTSSYRPDPAFIKRLENDALWQEDTSRPVRRTDRYADRRVDRRADRRPGQTRRPTDSTSGRVPGSKRVRRSRRVAVIVLVLTALVLVIAGLQMTDSSGGASGTTPFSLLPLDSSAITATTEATTATTEATTTSTTAASTTTVP